MNVVCGGIRLGVEISAAGVMIVGVAESVRAGDAVLVGFAVEDSRVAL